VIKHVSINITGKVQGVFFRASTKEKADELNVKGFVRNERDGSVYVEAEGTDKDLEIFIGWCKHGPKLAYVEHCDVIESPPKGFLDFIITK
jgi:acylphosphatase